MPLATPTDVIQLLNSRTLRIHTGIWLVTNSVLGRESSEAVRLGIDAFDARQPILEGVAEQQRFLGLNSDRVVSALDSVARSPQGTECLLVYNFDLLLARIRSDERAKVWQEIFLGLPHRPHALLIVMPNEAQYLLPNAEALAAWRSEGRLAEII